MKIAEPTLNTISQQIKEIYDQIRLVVEFGATKEDLKRFATKDDLNEAKTELKLEFKKEINDLRVELKTEIGKARDIAFVHADTKAVEAVVESGKIINRHKNKDKSFKQNLVAIMKSNSLANPKQLKKLSQSIS